MLLDILEPSEQIAQNTKDIIVGIDFGTTNSLIAIPTIDGAKTVNIKDKSCMLSSEIDIEGLSIKSIKRLFGRSLREINESPSISKEIKSILTEEGGQIYLNTPPKKCHIIEIAAMIFKKLKLAAEKEILQEVKRAVVTVPAYFDDSAKSMVKQSAMLAGIEVVRLIPEPTAACYFFGLDSKAEGRYMVYDLGGGTFDVSIVMIKNGVFKVEAIGGDSMLGGDDLDYAIAQFLVQKYQLPEGDASSSKFLMQAKFLKENIGQNSKSINGYELNQEELDFAANDLISKTVKIAKKVHRDVNESKLDGIILVGGSTRIPSIRQKLEKSFNGVEILDGLDPDTIVALGAGLQASNLYSKSSSPIIDLVPLSLGIELMGGLVEVIIPRNTPIPTCFARKFTTQVDGQTGMEFHIIQGDREIASLCRSLARFSIKNLTLKRAGFVHVEVKFQIDVDGLLSVSAREIDGDAKEEIEIKPTFGLSDKDLYGMLKVAMENIEKDREIADILKLKQEVKATISGVAPLLAAEIATSDSQMDLLLTKGTELIQKIDLLDHKELKSEFEIYRKLAESFINKMINKSLSEYLEGKNINQIV